VPGDFSALDDVHPSRAAEVIDQGAAGETRADDQYMWFRVCILSFN
jgi:hypothetical protein